MTDLDRVRSLMKNPRVKAPAPGAQGVYQLAAFLVLELDQAAAGTAITQAFPLLAAHLGEGLFLPETAHAQPAIARSILDSASFHSVVALPP